MLFGLRLLGLGKELQSVGEKKRSVDVVGAPGLGDLRASRQHKEKEERKKEKKNRQVNEKRRTTWKKKEESLSRVKLKAIPFS